MEHAHDVGPYPAARVPPEAPRGGSDFRVIRLCCKFVEGTEENSVRSPSGIEPQFCASRSQIDRIVDHVIRRAEKRAVPLLRESLPMQIVSGSCSGLCGGNARTMLMNDHGLDSLELIRDPKRVRSPNLQLPFSC